MLAVTRREGESIILTADSESIKIELHQIYSNQAKVAIEAEASSEV